MKTVTFIRPSDGKHITTSDRAEVKQYTAFCWKKVKAEKQIFAKGLTGGKSFRN